MDNSLLLLVVLFAHLLHTTAQYNIGFLINDLRLSHTIQETIEEINEDSEDGASRLNASWYMLSSDPLVAATDICEQLIRNEVYVIVTTNAVNSSEPPHIVSHVGAFYKIPVIMIEARNSELSDKKKFPTLLRVVPPYFDEARGWADLIRSFKWNKVNLVASNDYDGRVTYITFTTWAYRYNIVIEKPIMFPSGEDNLTSYLKPLTETRSNVIILACNDKDAIRIYKNAKELGITGRGYIWISNQHSITGKALDHAPQGLLVLRLHKEKSRKSYLRDAIQVLANTFDYIKLHNKTMDPPPSSCNRTSGKLSSGDSLYRALLNTSFDGNTGKVAFDWYGDRKHSTYHVYNVRNDKPKLRHVGILKNADEVNISTTDIIWPGNQTTIVQGVSVSNHLRVVTVESTPFVYVEDLPESGKCSDKVYTNPKNNKKIYRFLPCKRSGRKFCCTGFCMDLLQELAAKVNFTYDINLSEDGMFGSLKKVNGGSMKRWNGAVGEVVERKSDLIVASLTINNERAQYIEFSKPFKYQGITILVKTDKVEKTLFSFLQPFKVGLWLLVLLSVHLVAAILYLLDRFSPFGRYKLNQSNKLEAALDLSSAMWFSWGVLLNSGIGEGTPRSFSARVLGMVWAFFSMVIIASYTANLAAFLVLDRPKAVVSGVGDPALRNPSDHFKYGTVMESSVSTYFRHQVELSSMYTFMQKHNVHNESEGIEKVNNGELKAFMWDSPVLFHEASKNCDVTTAGELFGRSGYGIGMPKGSPWSNEISLAILQLHQSGTMEEFESKWIKFGNCPAEAQSTTLGLNHMLGVFIMVAGGIGAGIIIVILEVLYYKQKGWRKQQRTLLQKTAEHWQEKVKQRKSNISNISHEPPLRLHTPNGSMCVFGSGMKMNGVGTQSNLDRSNSNFSNLSIATCNPTYSNAKSGEVPNENTGEAPA